MNKENPITFTRKAIEGTAEVLADNDSAKKPNDEHYRKAFEIFRNAKHAPEIYSKLMDMMVNSHDLRILLGAERLSAFENVCREITEELVSRMEQQQIKLSGVEYQNFLHEAFIEIKSHIKNDPRIVSMFNGNDSLLDKAIVYLEKEEALFSLKGGEMK